MSETMVAALEAIIAERSRQEKLHGSNSIVAQDPFLPPNALSILAEEFGEVAQAINERDWPNLEEELIQVASVCVAWSESIREARENEGR